MANFGKSLRLFPETCTPRITSEGCPSGWAAPTAMDGEAAAAPPAPPGDGAAWWSLFGALHVNVAVAPVFAFGVMAPSFGRLAGSSPGGTAAIGVAANAGLWLNVAPGYAYDARGPRFATAAGLGLALAGYGATALALAARRAARDATLLRSSRVRIVGPRSAEKSRRAPSSRPHMTPSPRRRRPRSRRATSGRDVAVDSGAGDARGRGRGRRGLVRRGPRLGLDLHGDAAPQRHELRGRRAGLRAGNDDRQRDFTTMSIVQCRRKSAAVWKGPAERKRSRPNISGNHVDSTELERCDAFAGRGVPPVVSGAGGATSSAASRPASASRASRSRSSTTRASSGPSTPRAPAPAAGSAARSSCPSWASRPPRSPRRRR